MTRTRKGSATLAAALALVAGAAAAPAQEGAPGAPSALEARIWLDRGERPVLHRGDRVRLYYRSAEDAYVAIFQVDTDGAVHLLHPRDPREDHYVRGGRDYRVLFPRSPYWHVDEYPGVGYFFLVASRAPLDFSRFRHSRQGGGWDLSPVGRRVYEDPYQAMDDFVAALIPDWEYAAYGLGVAEYDVGRPHDYPRFLCYDCHGFRPYYAWNPYAYACTSFRLVIDASPRLYPVRRYGGRNVVYPARPVPRRGPRFSFKERAVGEPGTPRVVGRRPDPAPTPGGREARRRDDGPAPTSERVRPEVRWRDPDVRPGSRRPTPGASAPEGDGPRRRPTSVLPGRGGEPEAPSLGPGEGTRPEAPAAAAPDRPARRPTLRPRKGPRQGPGSSGGDPPPRPSARPRSGGRDSPPVRGGRPPPRRPPPPAVRRDRGGGSGAPAVRGGGSRGRRPPPRRPRRPPARGPRA